MIRWLFSFLLGLITDELRIQWRAFVEPWAVLDAEMREAVEGVEW